MRLLKKRFKAAPAASGSGIAYSYPVNPFGRREGSTPSAVIIDGVPYTLQGEPPPAKCGTSGFKGNGQR